MRVTATITQFCHNTWQLQSNVQMTKQDEEFLLVVTERTPFHPVSHIWPDHPADRGTLNGHSVLDCQVGAVELESGELFVGKAIPVKRDEPGWVFVVVHCLAGNVTEINENDVVTLEVDKTYQLSLSRGHSAGHIAYLALNKVLVEGNYWRKDADRKDPHGNYDFNSYAQESSFVSEDQCVDTYRLGKTLRKRGLNSADVVQDLSVIEEQVNQQIAAWLSLGSDIVVECSGERLTDSRYWLCDLNEGEIAKIPCGGTHVSSLKEFSIISTSLRQIDEQNIEMRSHVK